MNDHQAKPPSTTEPKLEAQPGHIGRIIRRSLTVVVVAAACYLAYFFGGLWAEWRQATQTQPHEPTATNIPSLIPMLPLAGHWSFGELDWNLRSNVVDQKVVAARFEEMAAETDVSIAQQLQEVSPELIELAHNLQIEPVERNGNQIYGIDRRDFKAQLVVRDVAGQRKAIALAAAFPQPDDQWQLLEFSPRASAGKTDAALHHLLPLPAAAQRSGGRFADDGQLLLELVALQSNAEELIVSWKSAGWDVHPSGLGDSEQFSYLCAHDGDVIYAWSADSRDALRNLMLVRTPNSADTNR